MGQVYSVEIFSPENRASDVLPLELDLETARRVAESFWRTTHLGFRVVRRTRWEPVPEPDDVEDRLIGNPHPELWDEGVHDG